jgi:hypothetical protein
MGQLPYVNSFKNLIAYQEPRAMAAAIFAASKQFPREEMYSLTDQVRCAPKAMREPEPAYNFQPEDNDNDPFPTDLMSTDKLTN